jgi:hypothetical protein
MTRPIRLVEAYPAMMSSHDQMTMCQNIDQIVQRELDDAWRKSIAQIINNWVQSTVQGRHSWRDPLFSNDCQRPATQSETELLAKWLMENINRLFIRESHRSSLMTIPLWMIAKGKAYFPRFFEQREWGNGQIIGPLQPDDSNEYWPATQLVVGKVESIDSRISDDQLRVAEYDRDDWRQDVTDQVYAVYFQLVQQMMSMVEVQDPFLFQALVDCNIPETKKKKDK